LEFVERIDDAVYELCKRGFFGRVLRDAARSEHTFTCNTRIREDKNFGTQLNRFIRLTYFLNLLLLLGGLTILVSRQEDGQYRCRSFSVHFGDETWDESYVELENGAREKRLLVYSHFNGIYVGEIMPILRNEFSTATLFTSLSNLTMQKMELMTANLDMLSRTKSAASHFCQPFPLKYSTVRLSSLGFSGTNISEQFISTMECRMNVTGFLRRLKR
jgi:hypothetical protein